MDHKKKKTLWILGSEPSNEILDKIDSNDSLLRFSLSSMRSYDKKIKDLKDFYSRDEFANSIDEFNTKLESFLKNCDKKIQEHGLGKSFYQNGFWFAHRFSDLFFLHQLCTRIKSDYDIVKIIVPEDFETDKNYSCSLNDLSLSVSLGTGLNHALFFMREGLPNSELVYEINNLPRKLFIWKRRFQTLNRLPDIIYRNFKKLLGSTKKISNTQKRFSIFVPQPGYDIDYLINSNFKTSFKVINFKELLKDKVQKSQLTDVVMEQLNSLFESFVIKNFPLFNDFLLSFLKNYLEEVALFSPSIEKNIKSILQKENPDALVYSNGATDLVERDVCMAANDLNIPIYFMRHQGIELNFLNASYLDKYCERDETINRFQFVLNKYELDTFPRLENLNYVKSGLIDLSKELPSKGHYKDILYSAGPPAHYTFKNLCDVITDEERYKFSSWLVASSDKFQLDIDIKVHPAEWNESMHFYSNLLQEMMVRRIPKLICDGSIERILKNYKVIVLDILSTRVLTYCLLNNLNVILYIPEGYTFNKETYADLSSKVYIVRDEEELEGVLGAYAEGNLNTKTSKDFDSKYLQKISHEEAVKRASKLILG